jgi:hypothetical protein
VHEPHTESTVFSLPLMCKTPEAVFKEGRGVWDPMLGLTIASHLISLTTPMSSFPPLLHTKMGGMGKLSPSGWEHLHLSANFHNMFFMSIGTGRVRGVGRKGWELTLCLRIYML